MITLRPSSLSAPASSASGSASGPLSRLLVFALALAPLFPAAPASALYPPDGLKPDGPGAYRNPDDGFCVVGLAADGTMLVDWDIANARDCVAYTRSGDGSVNLVGLDTQDKCTKAGFAGNDGYRHAWSTSLCYDTVGQKGISRVDLDNTDAMCFSKGGTVVTTGKCVAYGWVYRNRKSDGDLPVSGSGIGTTPGVAVGDGLGFCHAAMRMTSAAYNSASTCPSYHNSPSTAPAEWPPCASSASGCQTQASYDAGLGWSFSSSQCVYSYGLKGKVNSNLTKADGSSVTAGTTVDLTQYTTQGACLANGGSWDNWLPNSSTVVEDFTGDYPGIPTDALIMKLDAISSIEDGGGDFYSGTGAVCTKCHTDQSRSYQERNKPGFHKTRHRLAGDAIGQPFQPFFTAANSDWGLQGVQCAMCHSTAKPAQDDLIQVNPAGAPGAGLPKSASGHNNTEYGSHLIGICYNCHGTAAVPESENPASNIPASEGALALTDKGLAPIANMFLNSPHAKYSGTSAKVDVGNKNNYDSHFNGYVCRTAATQFRNNAAPGNSQANCQAAGHTWYTATGFGTFCYYNQTSCLALSTGQWLTSFDTAAYPWAAASGGPQGLCAGVGIGSIITTVFRDGQAERIHNVNSPVNEACTNPGDGSATSGAAGFWVRDGETSPGTPSDTSQGNCMTCHDVHWALADEDPEAEPLRRECTTCHAKDLGRMRHPSGEGTPLEAMNTHPNESCETCHMPNKLHLFRVSSDASYSTFPSALVSDTKVQTMADGDYADAAWVDVDLACGQCHGGGTNHAETVGTASSGSKVVTVASTSGFAAGQRVLVASAGPDGEDLHTHVAGVGPSSLELVAEAASTVADTAVEQNPVVEGAAYIRKARLARRARKIHNDAPNVRFTYARGNPNTLLIEVSALRTTCSGGPCDRYTWNWGDGSPNGSGVTASHEYAATGTYAITLTAQEFGVGEGSRTKKVNAVEPDYAPVADGTCDFDADTWTLTIDDASSDDNGISMETVDWGDGGMLTVDNSSPFGPFVRTYANAGAYAATHKVYDTIGQLAVRGCSAIASPFSIGGTVVRSDGTTGVGSATIQLKQNNVLKRTVFTDGSGAFLVGNLRPGEYTVVVSKSGFTFSNPGLQVTVGPDSTGNIVQAINP
jgi:hypothetical protein